MTYFHGRSLFCCLLALACGVFAQVVPCYNIVSRENTALVGEATSTVHVRNIVSREATACMGEATSTVHVRNIVSREYTAGIGEEKIRLLPSGNYVSRSINLILDTEFVQNPVQMQCNWKLSHGGVVLEEQTDVDWENFCHKWDTTAGEDGVYDFEMRLQRPDQKDVVLSRKFYVLNDTCITHADATISDDEVWENNGKVHVILGNVTIADGASLQIASGAIVKFVDGASLEVRDGGSLDISGVVLTHVADDSHGGDTNLDGARTQAQYNAYSFTASSQSTISTNEDTEFCYMSQTYSGSISEDTIWPGYSLILLTDDVTVKSGATLTILPGAIIKVAEGKRITIQANATLNAVGNRAQPIIFTSYHDDEHGGDTDGDGGTTSPMPGDWKQITVNGTMNGNYCRVLYPEGSNNQSAIYVDGGTLNFSNGEISHTVYDCLRSKGNSTITNTVFSDASMGFAPVSGDNTVNNCVFYGITTAVRWSYGSISNSVFLECIEFIDSKFYGSTVNMPMNNCVFYNAPSYEGEQSCPKVGISGNIWADPMFTDAENYDFTLRAGSPCIDAGDGKNAPETDYWGTPRCNDSHVTATGTADANGNYPDIGIYEMNEDGEADLDLIVYDVSGIAQATCGDQVSVTWQVANDGTIAGNGARRDVIYLVSADEKLGSRQIKLKEYTTSLRLAPKAIQECQTTVTLPSMQEGTWRFAVTANEYRDWYEGRNTANNMAEASSTTRISMPYFTAQEGGDLEVPAGMSQAFKLTGVSNGGALVILRCSGEIATGAATGQVPETASQGWQPVALGNNTYLFMIPTGVTADEIYIVAENEGENPVTIEFSVDNEAFCLFDNGIITATNGGTVTVPLYGNGLTEDMAVSLKNGGTVVEASTLAASQNGVFYATFDMTGQPVGRYLLYAANDNGEDSFEAVEITQKTGESNWWCKLEMPSAIRQGRQYVGYFVYGNSGQTDMPAPYVKLEGDTGVNVKMSANGVWGKNLELLALSSTYPVSVLKAGEEVRVPFYFIQMNDSTSAKVEYSFVSKELYSSNTSNDSQETKTEEPFPWDENQKLMRPSWANDHAWGIILARLKKNIGLTWNSAFNRLREDADYLAQLGQTTREVGVLWRLEAQDAVGIDQVVPTLASDVDLSRNCRGDALVLSRFYCSGINTRYRESCFGTGWSMGCEAQVELDDEISVLYIHLSSGNTYSFEKLDDVWTSLIANDKTTLTENDTEYILAFRNGIVVKFDKENGLMQSKRDNHGHGLDFLYDNGKLVKIVHTDGQWVALKYSGDYVIEASDDLGHTVTYGYSGNWLTEVVCADGTKIAYSYDDVTQGLRQIKYQSGISQDYTYDEDGMLQTMSENGNHNTVTIVRGRFGSYSLIAADGATNEVVVGAYGEKLYAIDAQGNKTLYKHDYTKGTLAAIQNPMGKIVSYEYNNDNQITRSSGTDSTVTSFSYTEDYGLVEYFTDARGNMVQYSYDDFGQGIGNILPNGKASFVEYAENGDLIGSTDYNGQKKTMQYDTQGHLVQTTQADGRIFTMEYDDFGKLTGLEDSFQGTTRLVYTLDEKLSKVTYPDGKGFSYEYDSFGRLISYRWTDGFEQKYAYDELGRIQRMTDGNGKLFVENSYDDVTGRLMVQTYGNGTAVRYTYDANGNVLSIVHYDKANQIFASFRYSYDAEGKRTGVETLEGTETYSYDQLGQLVSVIYPDGRNENFEYDAVGNRVKANGVAYSSNNLNQYVTVGENSFEYDETGNMIKKASEDGTVNMTFNCSSRLVKVERPDAFEWSCEYDSRGNRNKVITSNGTIHRLYDFGGMSSLVAEYDEAGTLLRRYVLLGNVLVADIDGSGQCRFYHADGVGSTRVLTDDNGTLIGQYAYDVFGKTTSTVGEQTRFGFVGTLGVELDETGLLCMRNRYYDAELGRFIQMDPIGIQGKDVNWYRYCMNNAVSMVDVNGLSFMGAIVSGINNFACKVLDFGGYAVGHVYQDVVWLGRGGWAGVKSLPEIADLFGMKIGKIKYIWTAVSLAYDIYNSDYGSIAYNAIFEVSDKVNSIYKGEMLKGVHKYIMQNASQSQIKELNRLSKRIEYLGKANDILSIVGSLKEAFDKEDPVNPFANYKIAPNKTGFGCSLVPRHGGGFGSSFSPQSCDPNEMVGPYGFGDKDTERFVLPGETLSFTVNFENKSSAAAAAQEVFVDAQLSEYLDWSSFELGSVLFCNQMEMGLEGKQRGSVLVSRNGTSQKVKIEVTMDTSTGKVRWYLRSYDPNTIDNWPEDAYDGFLPPNDDTHRGEGSVSYRVKVREDAPHGVRIASAAEIIFDKNGMIPTDPAWFNTVYADAPGEEFVPAYPDGTTIVNPTSLAWDEVPGATSYDAVLWKVVDGKDVQIASVTDLKMPQWQIQEYITDKSRSTYRWQITARNANGTSTSDVYSFSLVDQIMLAVTPGWNLISVPFKVEETEGGEELFSLSPKLLDIATKAHACAKGSLEPGCAVWVFSTESQSVQIWTKDGGDLSGLPVTLESGWNLTGICGFEEQVIDCRAAGIKLVYEWDGHRFVQLKIKDGTVAMTPGLGYWLLIDGIKE